MRRPAPSAMSKAETENRFFKSLQPSAEDNEIDRRMAHEAGRQRVRAAAIGLDRIIVDGRAAVEPLRDHLKVGPSSRCKTLGHRCERGNRAPVAGS